MPGLGFATTSSSRGDAVPTEGLARLVAEIGAACEGPAHQMPLQVVTALQAAAADPALLTREQMVGSPERYARHVLYADPLGRFTILSLVWGAGQFSPVHAHDTWCAYAVRGPELNETLFQFDSATQQAVPLRPQTRRAGYGCFAQSGLDQIHRLGNAGMEPAISIHVYGVEGARVGSHVNRVLETRQ